MAYVQIMLLKLILTTRMQISSLHSVLHVMLIVVLLNLLSLTVTNVYV